MLLIMYMVVNVQQCSLLHP